MSNRNKKLSKSKSSRARKRRLARKQCTTLSFETLEPKHLLAAITVGNATDLSNAPDTSSITALLANDGGDGISLREAITAANNTTGEDTLTFDGSVFTGGNNSLIRLTLGELNITDSLSIDGTSATDVLITGDANGDDVTVSGTNITDVSASFGGDAGAANDLLDDNSRVLKFSAATGHLTLTDLTVTGGRTTGTAEGGGGIRFNSSDSLALNQSTVSGNSTTGGFDFESGGGGVYSNSGSVTLTNSTISGNSTTGYGSQGGGIRTRSGDVTLTNSTISENSTRGTSGGGGGGIDTRLGDVFLINSTVSDNSTTGYGSRGGGIASRLGSVFLTNSTVSENSAAGRYGRGGGISGGESVVLLNSTVSGNSTTGQYSAGGGISISPGESFVLRNSIVAGNTGYLPDAMLFANGELTVENSLIGDTTGSGITAATGSGNILNQPAQLGPLADNGGPTQTHALLPGSPAIDTGDNALAEGLITDQRGSGFVRVEAGTVDIGSFELQSIQTAGQFVFYNNSSFDNVSDSAAIATDKVALRNGETATFENYTSFIHGINGIAVDLFSSNGLVASDFQFSFGNDDDVDAYATLDSTSIITNLTTVAGAGVNGSDRVLIEFADGAITNGWLQVTVLANNVLPD